MRYYLISIIVSILLASCGPSPTVELEANKDLVHRFAASINDKNWKELENLLTPDFHWYCQATPDVNISTREDFMKLQDSFLLSVPDQHITIEMLVAEGDKVAAYATYSGTQSGPMGPFPATGKSFNSKILSIFRVVDGRIADLWVEWDNLAMLTQLGLFPPPGSQGI